MSENNDSRDDVESLIDKIPEERLEDLIWVDFDEDTSAFNMLRQDTSEYNDSEELLDGMIERSWRGDSTGLCGAWLTRPHPFEDDTICVYRIDHMVKMGDGDGSGETEGRS